MLSVNSTSDINKDNYSYIDPVPDWAMVSVHVGEGFITFTLTGVCFLCLHIMCNFLLFITCYMKKLERQRFYVLQLMTVSMGSICRGVCLTVDPYARWNKLPVFFNNLLEQLAGPCAIVAFISMQNNLIKTTSLRIKWNILQTCGRLVFVLLVYSTSVVFLEVIMYYNYHLTSVRLFMKLQFVVLSVYSCVCFLCTGFKATVYLDQIRSSDKSNSRKFINDQSDTEADSKCLIGNSPKDVLKETHNSLPYMHDTVLSNETSTDSAENALTIRSGRTNRSHTRVKRKKKHRNHHQQQIPNNSFIKLKSIQNRDSPKPQPDGRQSKMENSEMTNTTETYSSATQDNQSGQFRTNISSTNNQDMMLGSPNKHQYSVSPSNKVTKGCILLYNLSAENVGSLDEFTPSTELKSESNVKYMDIKHLDCKEGTDDDCVSSQSDSIDENGYLADGENVNFLGSTRKNSIDRDSNYSSINAVTEQSIHVVHANHCTMHSTYSLVRVRQCAMLQHLITVAYFVTFTVVVNTIFHLYSIVGVYGILGTQRAPRPWPWFLFQVLHRLVEITLSTSLVAAVVIILRNKPRRRKRQSQHNLA